uniref:DUF4351 domain-containing protein n=1 Tax=Candidatus Kentrum sp. DK TaxID=2126562 RepID=A0A450S7D8_9GAMM|nr:MAG: hypothetical protein BECKDK2373C_GA0170839_101928 [Candidatus Kentron sp. DK]
MPTHCRYLLEKDTPDTLVLAILCNFGEHNHQAVVNHIFTRLQSLLGNDHKRFREYVEMLHVLSVNRDIDKEIKEAEKMLTQVDIERIPAYQLGMERGMERGIEEGIELGQGKGEALFFLRLLGHKFGPVPAVLEERIGNARHEELALWGQRVLNAKTFDEVFSSS